VLGVGELARLYRPNEWAPTAAQAREIALGLVRPGDAILVKGSRSVGLEVVADSLRGSAA
jgi:UDP-N-acetylmuramyl pentapeptide synthase